MTDGAAREDEELQSTLDTSTRKNNFKIYELNSEFGTLELEILSNIIVE